MKQPFSKMLLTSALALLLSSSAALQGWNSSYNACEANCCDNGFAVSADFLYWDVCQEDMDIATVDTDSDKEVLTNAEVQSMKFRYKPGFRVAAAYRLPCSCWAFKAVYAYYHPRMHKTFTAPNGGKLLPTTFPQFILGPILGATLATVPTESKASLKIKYDLLDLLATSNYCCNECFTLQPYGGVRVLWFREELQNASSFSDAITGDVTPITSDWRVTLPVAGITLGAEGKYTICGCLSFTGRLGGSLLGGRAKHHQDWFVGTTDIGGISTGSFSERRHACQVVVGWDAALGFAYDWTCGCLPIELSIGYEIQDWWNMPQRARYTASGQVGSPLSITGSRFTVHGLYVGAGVAF